MIVYMFTCNVSGKSYIGQTSRTMQERWDGHKAKAFCQKSNGHFHRALRKYGTDAFVLSILWEGECTTPELDTKEMHFISLYDTVKHGYNRSPGGRSARGWRHSDAARAAIAKANKGKTISDDVRQKISDAHKGKECGQSMKDALRALYLGTKRPENICRKISDGQRGRNLPDAWRKAISLGLTGTRRSEETKSLMSRNRSGKPWTAARRALHDAKKALCCS